MEVAVVEPQPLVVLRVKDPLEDRFKISNQGDALLRSQRDSTTQVEASGHYIHTGSYYSCIIKDKFADILQQLAGCRLRLPNFPI